MIFDYTQHQVCSDTVYNRIISLVPSTSESIVSLGAAHKLIAVTHFCTEPAHITKKLPKIGGTKTINLERIEELKPDLILANAEENTKEHIMALRQRGHNVYVSFPKNISEAINEIKKLALLLKCSCEPLCTDIQNMLIEHRPFSYIYLIWNNPLMTISSDCFIASMLAAIGGKNRCENQN